MTTIASHVCINVKKNNITFVIDMYKCETYSLLSLLLYMYGEGKLNV